MAVGLTQDKLAKSLGITFQQIQKYEKGVNRIGAGASRRLPGFWKSRSAFSTRTPPGPCPQRCWKPKMRRPPVVQPSPPRRSS